MHDNSGGCPRTRHRVELQSIASVTDLPACSRRPSGQVWTMEKGVHHMLRTIGVVGRVAQAVIAVVALTAGLLVPATALSDPGIPGITSVSLLRPTAAQTVTITGSGFGSLNPYNADSSYLRITDLTANWTAGYLDQYGNADGVTTNITSWTDSQIVVSGFGGIYGSGILNSYVFSAGDTVEVDVWNPQTGVGPASIAMMVTAGTTVLTPPPTLPGTSPSTPSCSGGSYSVSDMCEGSGPAPTPPSGCPTGTVLSGDGKSVV